MKLLFILLFIILFFIFIPIPFRFNIHFSLDDYYIKFYGFSLISKEKTINKKNESITQKKSPPLHKKNKNSLLKKEDLSNIFKTIDYKDLISDLYYRKYKPSLYLDTHLAYSLSDAAKTALLYGALNNLNGPLYMFLKIIFKFKKYNMDIEPIFKDELLLDFDADSIFFLSIAEIICIISILIKHMRNCKEVAP